MASSLFLHNTRNRDSCCYCHCRLQRRNRQTR